MITALIWTYSGDALLVPLAVEAFDSACRRAGWQRHIDYSINVIDDVCQPCPPETRDACVDMGVIWQTSSYWRMGTLNGQQCIVGMLGHMFDSCFFLGDSDPIVVKIDPDTIVRGIDWLIKFRDDKSKAITGADDRGNVYGMCYALRGRSVMPILQSMYHVPVHKLAPEDQTIGFRARMIGGADSFLPIPLWQPCPLPNSVNGPHGTATPYYWTDEYGCPDYDTCEIITLGSALVRVSKDEMATVGRILMDRPLQQSLT